MLRRSEVVVLDSWALARVLSMHFGCAQQVKGVLLYLTGEKKKRVQVNVEIFMIESPSFWGHWSELCGI